MSYSNEFLPDFRPVYMGILKAKGIEPDRAEVEIIDEESDGISVFDPSDIRDVLEQLSLDLNFLTIYTERPAYFGHFAETMYEENGLLVMIFPKSCLKLHGISPSFVCQGKISPYIIFDFEWQGSCYEHQIVQGKHYIPIHKKPWEMADNLDIIVPIGYNTVIVKRTSDRQKKPWRDRFEAAFYSS